MNANVTIEFSIVVPVYNEAGNVSTLVSEIAAALEGRAYEMIFVDDASKDSTRAELVALKQSHPQLVVLSHRKNAGQSRAMRTGILQAKGAIIGTLDGDGQNDPADLPDMYRVLTRTDAPDNLGMIGGRRANRRDSAWKKFGSRFANAIRKRILNDGHEDSGCGIRVMYRDAVWRLPYFDHFHRYLPALMKMEGFEVESLDVNHRERSTGVSKYTNFGRLFAALYDLRGIIWLKLRRRDPQGFDRL